MEEVTSIANNLFAITRFLGALIGSIGVTIIFVGCIRGLYLFLKKFLTDNTLLADIRIDIGHHLALGLEFLVAKDIIETIVRPTWDELGKLAAIIALRTLLTLFLAHEVKEVREELEEESLIKTLRGKMLGKK
ncbi:MAG TPA: DUF1622 domain-containing protein [Candidatus Peribacterales bacterium]|nr:DUF1622 domain-containing protein [Candidatus Peribacterales bacterium]